MNKVLPSILASIPSQYLESDKNRFGNPISDSIRSKNGLGYMLDTNIFGKFNAMLNRLIELDKEDGKTPPVDNQRRDILIAETAIKLKHTLITNDGNLRKVVGEFGGHSIKFRTLSSRLAKNGRSFSRE